MPNIKNSAPADTPAEKSFLASARETVSMVLWALGIALILRTFLFQPFHIPSGSMEPNLLIGDYVITSKYSVGYGKFAADPLPFPWAKGRLFERAPHRGDIMVFKPLNNPNTFIKRLAGLPGDQIQMKKGVLLINGQPVTLRKADSGDIGGDIDPAYAWLETFPEGKPHIIYDKTPSGDLDMTSVFIVPAGHYFFLGDNRDESADSRVPYTQGGAGYVPAENIIGRAEFVLLSVTAEFSLFKPWTWGHIRRDRFFKGLR